MVLAFRIQLYLMVPYGILWHICRDILFAVGISQMCPRDKSRTMSMLFLAKNMTEL